MVPIQEYADVISWIMQERGHTVGTKNEWHTDITLNISETPPFIVVGSLKNDRYYCTVSGNNSKLSLGTHVINLAEPDSCGKIGDLIEVMMNMTEAEITSELRPSNTTIIR